MSCTPTCIAPSPSNAHCAAEGCHVTFGGVGGFDRHRRDGECLTPAKIGYTADSRGVYRAPLSDTDRERLAAMRGRNTDAPSACTVSPQTAQTVSGVGLATIADSEPAETLCEPCDAGRRAVRA